MQQLDKRGIALRTTAPDLYRELRALIGTARKEPLTNALLHVRVLTEALCDPALTCDAGHSITSGPCRVCAAGREGMTERVLRIVKEPAL